MRPRNNDTSILYRRSPRSFVSMSKDIEVTDSGKPSKERQDNPRPPKWRKFFRSLKDLSSVVSLLVSLLKFLQELGVL